MKKLILIALLVLIAIGVYANLLEEITVRGILRVGMGSGGFMPLHGTNVEGKQVGLELDMLEKMADILGVKLQIVLTNWDGIIPALLSGKFDILCSSMTITPERALKLDFSVPYLTVGQTIIYNNKRFSIPPQLNGLMNDRVIISTLIGSTGYMAAKRMFLNSEILTYDSSDEAALQVSLRNADIMVIDSIYADNITKKYDQLSRTEQLFTKEKIGIAIRKGDLETLRWIDTFIEWLNTTGLMQDLERKWFENYVPE